jgi:hypothetical protein
VVSPGASRSYTMTFQDSLNVTCSIAGHNHSSKSLILSAIELTFTRPSGEPVDMKFHRDHFFKPLTISLPKSDWLISSDCRAGTELDVPRKPAMPQAHAKVLFLQYEDGSLWGNAKAGARLITERREVLAFLKSLKQVYSADGPDGLARAVAKDQKPGSMISSKLSALRMLRDYQGISAVAETINENLKTAELRDTLLITLPEEK